MTSKTFSKINDIFQCKLFLEDGTEFTIPLREDGYIYATALCKASGKRINNWLRIKETQEFIKKLEIPVTHESVTENKQVIEVYYGGNEKYSQGTWIHPDLGLQLAQWCSTNFSLQVSKWMKELIFTDKVELTNEKSNNDIVNELAERLKKVEEELKEKDKIISKKDEELKHSENIIVAYDSEAKKLSSKYNKIYINHQAYMKRKELYKLREGQCVYLVNMTGDPDDPKIKIGQTKDVTNYRIGTFRTSNPFCKLLFVMYSPDSILIEKNMKTKYAKELYPNNSEFVANVDVNELIDSCIAICDLLNISYELESEEELQKFNRHIITVEEAENMLESDEEEIEIDTNNGFRRCGGITHKTEEERMQPITNFFKNKSNRSGVARLCKECYLTGVYGDKRKRRKKVVIPEFDPLIHKWCNRCESVRQRTEFQADKTTKDGLSANCKACKRDQKQKYLEKKKLQKKELENDINNEEEIINMKN
jgi:hypothetical protein